MTTHVKQYGFIKPTIDHTHYIFGGSTVPEKVLQEDGDWESALAQKDIQNISFDTFNCTGFNTLKQIQTYLSIAFNDTTNYSDRWLGIIAGTKPPGNNPQTVYEAIRKYGLIPESMLPWDIFLQSVDEYYSFKGADKEACYAAGREWLRKYDFKHEWVFHPSQPDDEKIRAMKQTLTYSPLALAVYAWETDERGIYIRNGEDCHWTFMYCFDDIQRVMDSYEPLQKNVSQSIFYCKRIHIDKRVQEEMTSLWKRILQFVQREIFILKYFYYDK